MASPQRQAVIPREIVDQLLIAGAPKLILVGGQALKWWVGRYGIALPREFSYVSHDVDFLTESAADADVVRRLARVLGGRAVFPRRRGALTALVGQAIKDVTDEDVFNVDVLHRVFGADDGVRARALEFELEPGVPIRLMHPLDVLKSRLDNLYGLAEKQNELGKAQLRAGIAVARAFQLDAATVEARSRRPATLRYASFVERLALGDAGKKVAARYEIHVADAIEPGAVKSPDFRKKKLPQLARLMSRERRRELGLP